MQENVTVDDEVPVLVGPPWCCPICGAPASGLVNWSQALSPQTGTPTQIDDWGEYIWYLYGLPQVCKDAGHPARVVRVGNAITPVAFPYDASGQGDAADQIEAVRRIQAAVGHLVAVLEIEEQDPLTALVYRLVAGRMSPERAIGEIRAMFDRQLAGALLPDLALPAPISMEV